MNITSLRLKQFRSYSDFSIELGPGVNIIVGPNASGKTNLLEAVQVAAIGSSYRANDIDLIQFGKNICRIEMQGIDENRVIKIENKDDKSIKTINIDNVAYKRMSAQKLVPVTLFEPEHMRMVGGSPQRRRDYLDTILELTSPGYKNVIRQYKRALSQRNRLLKQDQKIVKDQLFVWDLKISEFGAIIMEERINLVARINKDANSVYEGLSGQKHKVEMRYATKVNVKDIRSSILKLLSASLKDDIMRGFTSVGPHRDDMEILLRGHNAQTSASRGETRSIVLMCKIVELKVVEEKYGTKPILLLDDVFSELDSKRRMSLTSYLKDYQVIITTTDADSVLEHFLVDTNVIALEQLKT